ncbi:MAG: zinc ribbon domain-containing protein [Oscillospiraceae bacterium]|jgi:hypothetical protein|nr:zinc ribbon domain-containing protein [Oscillospiraceae bacterium]
MMKMICPNCGKEYNEKMTCCISCGTDLVPYTVERGTEQSGQIAFEPLIPEESPTSEAAENLGFVREIAGHSSVAFEPSEPAPSEENEIPVPVSAAGRKGISVSGAAKFTGSLAVSLMMFAFILLFSVSSAVRLATSGSKIAHFAESLDVMNLPASEAAIPTEGYGVSGDATVQEAIFVMSQGTGLSRDDIKTIYEASTIQSFMTSQLTEYAEFVRSGKIPEKLTADKLKSLFSENLSVIDDALGKPLSQHDINLAFSEIDSVQPVLDKLSPASLEELLGGGGITALRLLSTMPVIIGAAALAAAMLPLLRAINRKNSAMLRWGGVAVLAGGAAVSAAVFLFTVQPAPIRDRLLKSIAKCAADVIAPDLYRIGGILAVLGAVMLIWAGTLKKAQAV